MDDNSYIVVAGFVQFEPNARSVNGRAVRDVKVRSLGSQKIVRATIWPEFGDVPLERGDFIVVEGKYRSSFARDQAGNEREYHDVDARNLVRIAGSSRASEPQARTQRPPHEPSF